MRRSDGFKGQRTIVIPHYIIKEILKQVHSHNLYITDIGYYPNASDHYRTRPQGCSQYILMYCVAGSGWISVDSQHHAVNANQYFIIPANKPHSYASSEFNPWTIYWVHYSGNNAAYYSSFHETVRNITPSNIDRIEDRLTLFDEMLHNLEMGYSLDNLNYANICLSHFLASFCYLTQYRQIRSNKEFDLVDQSIRYMKENLHKKLCLADLSADAGLSASHYSLLFKQKTGRTPVDYLIQLKVQKACQLLDHSTYRIFEIARAVGYDDPYYFSRIFSKLMNQSPKGYRANFKG